MAERTFLVASGALGFLAVAFGAFGAHALRSYFAGLDDGAARSAWWSTAVQYHLAHALAVALAGYLASRQTGAAPMVAGWAFIAGVILFSGSLYVMSLTGLRFLGAVTPFGGLLLLVGWGALVVAALGLRG